MESYLDRVLAANNQCLVGDVTRPVVREAITVAGNRHLSCHHRFIPSQFVFGIAISPPDTH
jgi:hypothetical protein